MPASFEKCAREGGRVRTVSGPNREQGLAGGEYIHYCFKDGKSYRGEVKKKEKTTKRYQK